MPYSKTPQEIADSVCIDIDSAREYVAMQVKAMRELQRQNCDLKDTIADLRIDAETLIDGSDAEILEND